MPNLFFDAHRWQRGRFTADAALLSRYLTDRLRPRKDALRAVAVAVRQDRTA